MNIHIFLYALNALLMIVIPFALAFRLTKYWKLGWRIWWIGAASFAFSQVGHIPFNALIEGLLNRSQLLYLPPVVQAILYSSFLGLSAGVFEEGARLLILRYWAKDCRSWRKGILFGAGHGGAEAIILGILALIAFAIMLVLRDINLTTILPNEQIELARQQMAAYWSLPWYGTLLGALERIFAIPIQLALTILVLQVFTQKRLAWLWLAILYHALVDGMVVFLIPKLGIYWTEVLVAGFSVLSIVIIFLLRQPEPTPEFSKASSSRETLSSTESMQENK